jgi:hypothetical protein
MTSKSLLGINLLSPVLFYQNPVDIYQTQEGSTQVTGGGQCDILCGRKCNKNLASDDPASQYQRQKLIQNTVRVYASLYTMNLAGLSGYQKPLRTSQIVEQAGTPYVAPANVYWNQMSDRARPAHQNVKIASGSTYHTSSTRHTITRNRPGAMSPGGVGCDIKHNSYDRYLNKLKGKAPLRRGIIPSGYGEPIPFNRAFPVYGGKTVKTSIINGCDCPDITDNSEQDKRIYGSESSAILDKILSVKYEFNIGDFVWAKKFDSDSDFYKAEIINIVNDTYTVKFDDDITRDMSYCELLIYFDCNCDGNLSLKEKEISKFPFTKYGRSLILSDSNEDNIYCNLLNILATEGIL